MPETIICPCCAGSGKLEALRWNIPNGWLTLPMLAAKVGLPVTTVKQHVGMEWLSTIFCVVKVNGRRREARLVAPSEQERYVKFIRNRHFSAQRPMAKTLRMFEMLKAQSLEDVAKELRIEIKSIVKACQRHHFDLVTRSFIKKGNHETRKRKQTAIQRRRSGKSASDRSEKARRRRAQSAA